MHTILGRVVRGDREVTRIGRLHRRVALEVVVGMNRKGRPLSGSCQFYRGLAFVPCLLVHGQYMYHSVRPWRAQWAG